MDIEQLEQAIKIINVIKSCNIDNTNSQDKQKRIDGFCIGEKVIVRTCSAGVWYGTLEQKSGNEVILGNARRMWRWWAKKSISLSGVAKYGVKQDKSKITAPVIAQWLEAIEITPCTKDAIESIEGCKDAEAE